MRVNRILKIILEKEGININNKTVSRHFVSRIEIKRLNNKNRGVDNETDVLSFPQFSNIKEIFLAEKMYKDHKMLLGDIIICKNIAKKQAEKIGNTVDEEILYLTIHSILHILGYNHENMQDKKLMRKREKEILEKIRSVSTV